MQAAVLVPLASAALAVVIGCAHTNVQDLGQGRYSLTATAPSGGFDGSREAAVEDANEFCKRQGAAAVTDGFYDKSGVGPHGERTTSILFRCAVPQPLRF
ncbi:MAG: hypothetical protein WA747_15690 [Steroidobacteraceae bacterium]